MDDKWFKSQLKKAGVTAGDVARHMGRTNAAVSHIMTGNQRMSLDWAKAFSEVLQVPLEIVLEKAGVTDGATAQVFQPGFAESDVAVFVAKSAGEAQTIKTIGQIFGERPGVDVWRVKSRAMSLHGLLEGDFMLVDTHQAERVKPGDVVVAQVYNRTGAITVLRKFEPPVLVACSMDPADARVYVVDGVNVVIRGKVTASWRN